VDTAHPLSVMFANMRKAGVEPVEITMGPLSVDAADAYIAASVGLSQQEVKPLSRVAWEKTHGNPFFLGQFLRALVEEGALHFDTEQRKFVWDIARIEKAEVTENVGALMSRKVGRFSAETRRALEVGAAIGPTFNLGAVARILKISANRAADALWPALEEGLVFSLDGDYRLIGNDVDVPEGILEQVAYRFLHDRVKEACYRLVEQSALPALHLAIARELSRAGDPAEGDKLVDIANHYNMGASEIKDADERLRVARIDLHAGKRAMAATAYRAAADLSAAGRNFIGATTDAIFANNRELGFSLWLLGAESELLVGGFERAEGLLSELLGASTTVLERARVHELRMHAYINQGRFADALAAGLAGLAEFSITFPDTVEARHGAFGQGIGTIFGLIGGKPIEELGQRERLNDAAEEQAQKLLGDLAIPTFYVDSSYYGPVIIELVRRSFVIGQTMTSPWGYILFGFLLGAIIGQREPGAAFGRLALSLSEQWKSPMLVTRTHITYMGYGYTHSPLRTLVPYLGSCRNAAVEAGDFVYLAQACFSTAPLLLTAGISIDDALEELDTCLALVRRTGDAMATVSTNLSRQIFRALAGKTLSRDSLDEEGIDTQAELAKLNPMEHGGALFYFHAMSAFWHVVNGDHEAALAAAGRAHPFAMALMGMFWTLYLPFVEALALAERARKTENEDERRADLEKIAEARTKLAGYVDSIPANFRHRIALLDAVYAQAKKDAAWDVLALYDKAIHLARESDAPHEEALANEFAGRLLLRCGRPQAARGYFIDAYRAYRHWGADAKTAALLEELPDMFVATIAKQKTASVSGQSQTTAGMTLLGQATAGTLRDAALVLRAVQMIAGELVVSEVVRRLMRLVMENATAERGALLLARNDILTVEAKFQASPENVDVGLEQPLESDITLAVQPILHAFRTRESLLIDDAQNDLRFSTDAYVASRVPRSILCLPITHQGRTTGILYLETRTVEGAFTAVRVELLALLASQAAVAIQNAMLVEEIRSHNTRLEQDVERRTVEIEQSNAELKIANQRLADQLDDRAQAEREREALREQILVAQRARLAELSAPLMPITNDVLVMPIIGSVDGERANAIMEAALSGAQRHGARAMILDVTGMRQIDTQALSALLLVANALRLLGTRPLLTGVRAEVAQTIIGLGAGLDGLETLSTLQAGIARVIRSPDAPRNASGNDDRRTSKPKNG
jgi:predicted ATPase/GAF domain-containing protein